MVWLWLWYKNNFFDCSDHHQEEQNSTFSLLYNWDFHFFKIKNWSSLYFRSAHNSHKKHPVWLIIIGMNKLVCFWSWMGDQSRGFLSVRSLAERATFKFDFGTTFCFEFQKKCYWNKTVFLDQFLEIQTHRILV